MIYETGKAVDEVKALALCKCASIERDSPFYELGFLGEPAY